MRKELLLPKLGESILNATIVRWFKKEGEHITIDEPLLEVATDKVSSEIPSPFSGLLEKIVAADDSVVQVGGVLAYVNTAEGSQESVKPVEQVVEKVEEKTFSTAACPKPLEKPKVERSVSHNQFFSPVVVRIASLEGIPLEELEGVEGTGSGGRVSKRDLEAYLTKRQRKASVSAKPAPCPLKGAVENRGDVSVLKMGSMRKAIAENMVKSFYQAPHASLVAEIDVTPVMDFIALEKERVLKEEGCKLTVTSFIIKAIADALKNYPLLNASVDGDSILVKHHVNVGIAVSVEGGILVPVIKRCQEKSVVDIAKAVGDVSRKARDGKLGAGDTLEGSITLTNFGMSEAIIGVPIIRHPEVAIIGVGAVKKKVAVLPGDLIGIRHMMHATLTFDHRLIDGMYGCGFIGEFKKLLEESQFQV